MKIRSVLTVSAAAGALLTCGVFAAGNAPAGRAASPQQNKSIQTIGADMMADDLKSSTLNVPGASLYYEMRGQGPVLLVIPGGPQDAGVFADLARHLADRYTVVTYDPRGNSRSRFDGEAMPLDVDVQADDAAALIEVVNNGPAYVFGTSGGAQIGLNLAARHPGIVHALVAHEPPAMMLLDDPEPALAADRDLHETYLNEGIEAAMGKFFAMNGLDGGAAPEFDLPPEAAETFERVSGNFGYWLAHGMIPLSTYLPDIAALKRRDAPVVVAIGDDSAGQPIDEMSRALAAKLGVDPASFPGDHMGFEMHAAAFAERLHRAFLDR